MDAPAHFDAHTDFPDEIFHSSVNSQLGQVRKWVWLGALFVAVAGSFIGRGSPGITLFTLLISALVAAVMHWFIRRKFVAGEAVIALTQAGIESRLFSSNQKKYPWTAVAGATLERVQNQWLLQIQLDSNQGLRDKRSFWTGVNHSRPSIVLSTLETGEQERLYDAVRRRIRLSAVSNTAPEVNPMAEEREFHERLKSFAPIPWATYGLIGLNVLVWLAMVATGTDIGGASTASLLHWGGNAASEFQRGDWWRLASAMFLHSGLMHLAMNMIGLASAGVMVERVYGWRQFILLYLGSGLIGSALSLHFSAQHAVSVGASGAVFGVAGALLVGLFQHRNNLPKAYGKQALKGLGFFIAYSLIQGFARQGIDNAAHVGGLIGGALLAYVLPERFDMAFYVRNLARRSIVGVAIVTITTVALALAAPKAEIDQRRLIEGQAAFQQALKGFDAVMKAASDVQQKIKSGQLTQTEGEQRGKTVLVPMLREVKDNLAAVYLVPSDPRNAVLKDITRLSELFLEALEMPLIHKPGNAAPEPADPVRLAAIEAESAKVAASLKTHMTEAQAKRGTR